MTQSKNTKRAFLASVLSIVICLTMLIGSTFAWFTDTATTGVNTIKSGNLDVELQMSCNNGKTWEDAENKTLEFRNANGSSDILWEPGAEFKLPQLRIKNAGNLALKYKVVVSGLTGDMMLADVLDVKLNGSKIDTLTNVMALNAAEVDGLIHGELIAEATSDVYEVSLKMQEEANNDYMNKTLSGLCITVYATQDDVEWDSWTNDYDAGATYSDEATIKDGVPVVLHSANATVSIPANTLTAGQVVKLKEANAENSETAKTVVTVDNTLITAKDISIVDADGNEVAMPTTGTYTVTMNIGTGLDASNLAVYHKENKVEPINYNATSGIVTFTTNSFSPFTVIYENIGTIASAAKLVAVRDSINAGDTKAGVVYNVTKDIDLSGVEWTAISNFAGTFNGQGHTISNMNANLFGTVSGTVENLKVDTLSNGFIYSVLAGGVVEECTVSNMTGSVFTYVNAGATVQNCEFNNITLKNTDNSSGYHVKNVGAVFCNVSGTVKDCVANDVNFIVTNENKTNANSQNGYAGGVIGAVHGGGVVDGFIINDVDIVIDRAYNFGGIIGKAGISNESTLITLNGIKVNGLKMAIGNTDKGNVCNVGGFIGQVDFRKSENLLNVTNCHITGLDMTLATAYDGKGESYSAGFIAGINAGATITDCSVSGKIDGTYLRDGVGGFVGDAAGWGSSNLSIVITDCVADVTIVGNEEITVGGFVGCAGRAQAYPADKGVGNSFTFTNCEAKGNATNFYGVEDSTAVNTYTNCKVNGANFNG